jgi:Tfp pilus assembly protein FimT
LVELLVAVVIMAALFVLGASAFRGYWVTRSLNDSATELVSQLRQLQEQAVSETHPLVYGVRMNTSSSFDSESNKFRVIRYDPNATSGPECRVWQETRRFESGVFVSAAEFTEPSWLSLCPGNASEENHFVFFYARGTATAGELTLGQSSLDRTESVTVTAVTGRVENP